MTVELEKPITLVLLGLKTEEGTWETVNANLCGKWESAYYYTGLVMKFLVFLSNVQKRYNYNYKHVHCNSFITLLNSIEDWK